tara:strand:- start:22167 stop:22835 length:669 start_codon:yes stop_codon:yes gene_type:complete
MSDSSTLFPVNTSLSCSVLNTDKGLVSLYVPVIPPSLYFTSSETIKDEDNKSRRFQPKFLKYYIENSMRIGKVRRIDFATREVPQYTTPQVCAFIHFDCFYDNDTTKSMLTSLDTEGKYRSYGFETDDGYVKLGGQHSNPHLLFKINHKPIDSPKEYERNIEQVMAENKLLIEKLQEKEETIRQVQGFLQYWKDNDDPNINIVLSGLQVLMGESTNEVETSV